MFKVGQTVQVKKGLIGGTRYPAEPNGIGVHFALPMEEYCGNRYRIEEIEMDDTFVLYHLEGICEWVFSESMLIPAAGPLMTKLKERELL